MASKKGSKNDLNAPLRTLSERLRSLQREAGQLLEAARNESSSEPDEPRSGLGRVDLTAGLEAQFDRVAASLIERWDIPTRADLDALHERLARIEDALADAKPKRTPKVAKKVARTSKSRRTRGSA